MTKSNCNSTAPIDQPAEKLRVKVAVADQARERIFLLCMMLGRLKDDSNYDKADMDFIAHILDDIYMDLEPVMKYLSTLIEKDE